MARLSPRERLAASANSLLTAMDAVGRIEATEVLPALRTVLSVHGALTAMAEECAVSKAYLCDIKQGKRQLTRQLLVKLARAERGKA